MIPLKDINPSERYPLVTVLIITACVLVFIYELSLGEGFYALTKMFGVIPAEITKGIDIFPPDPLTPYGNLIAHQYLHGSLWHIAGNMLFLWIFGDNVEDTFGRLQFFTFYTLCGITAALIQVAAFPHSTAPLIGASGAISGVLGAYLVLFPRARIITLVFFGFFFDIVAIKAYVWIAVWFLIQVLNASLTAATPVGGIAWFAHIGGFLAGMMFALFKPHKKF